MGEKVSTNKQIAKNIIYNNVVFGLNIGISFFLTPYLVKHIGKEAYSFYPLIGNLIGYSSIMTTAVGSMAGRFIAMSLYKGDKEEAEEYFNSMVFAYWLLSLFFSVVLLFIIIYVDSILTVPVRLLSTVRWMLFLTGVGMIIGLVTTPLGIGTYVKNRVDLNAIIGFSVAIINLLAIVLLFYFFEANVLLVSIAALLSTFGYVYFKVKYKKKLLSEFRYQPFTGYSWQKIRALVASGIWNSVNQLSSLLLTQLDLLIANIYLSVAVTGEYALVKILPNLMYSLFGIMASSFTPNFNILYAQGKMEELKKEILKSIKIVGCMSVIPLGFLMVFAQDFFSLWVPLEDATYLSRLSCITLLPMVLSGAINPVFSVYSIVNKLRIPSIVLLGSGIVNTVVILVLLKTTNLGVWSIAIVGAIQIGLRNLFFTPVYAAKCLNFKMFSFYPTIFKTIFSLSVVVLIGWFVRQNMPIDSWFDFILAAGVVGLFSLGFNVLFLLTRSERKLLLQKVLKKR